jgi:TolA-binding protein
LPIKPENRFWIYIYGFAAIVMLVALAVFAWLVFVSKSEPGVGRVAGALPASAAAPNPIPDEEYEHLAAFDAPAFMPQPGESPGFRAAMSLYDQQDYAGAARALRALGPNGAASEAARFYLGISLLLSGDRIAGIQELRALAESGDGAYLDRARFYLAKGLLAEHDLKRAEEQLEKLAAQHGELAKQAAALLAQIHSS